VFSYSSCEDENSDLNLAGRYISIIKVVDVLLPCRGLNSTSQLVLKCHATAMPNSIHKL